MDKTMKLITTYLEFGTAIFSFGCAIFTLIKAKSVKKDVDYVKKAKMEIIERENLESISVVREEVTKIKTVVRSYITKSGKSIVAGRSLDKDILIISDSLAVIKENRSIFNIDNENKSDQLYVEIKSKVDDILGNNYEDNELRKTMREVDTRLDNFLAELKELKTVKKYR